MDSLHLHTSWASDVTLIPNYFLDRYMLKANGEFVKIYLYLLRNTPESFPSLSVLADKMNCTEGDILRAIRYWEQEGLLLLEFDDGQNLADISFIYPEKTPQTVRPPAEPVQAAEAIPPSQDTQAPEPPPKPSQSANPLTADRVSQLKENEDIIQLLYIAEQYLGRPLSTTDTNKLLYFYEELHFDPELIEFLVEYCVSRNHTSIRYIEKVALSWAEQGISTVSAAKEESQQYSKTYFTIFKALGIQNRNPVKSETEIMDRWISQWGFTMDMILEACKRTVLQTGSGSFPYTDKILEGWHSENVRHLTDLEAADASHKSKAAKPTEGKTSGKTNRFNDYPHRDYDFEQIKKSMFQQ